MRFRDFLISLGICWTSVAQAQEYERLDHLRSVVYERIQQAYLERYEQDELEQNIEIQVSNLDARLKLNKCDIPIDARIASPNTYANNITVKLSCNSAQRWSIYVPAAINQYAIVAVAAHSLARGHIVTESDLEFARMNIRSSGAGLIKDPDRIIGKQLKRSLQTGNPLRLSHLKLPHVVKKGQKVSLQVKHKSLSVVANGMAMDNGEVGQQIKVQNANSKRIVDAVVVAPGVVEVQY